MKYLCGLVLGLLVLTVGPLPAEPPKQGRALTSEEQKEVVRGMRATAEGRGLLRRMRYRDAEAKFREALGVCLKVLGEDRLETANAYNDLGFCLNSQGRYAEALPLLRKAVASFQKAVGERRPETAAGYSTLGFCLNGLGRYAEALRLHRRALDIRLGVRGDKHPETAQSYNNVADCLNSLGRHAEALSLFRKALAIKRVVPGEWHPETAGGYSNLAFCLDEQGRHAEALPLHQKALAIYLRALGELHPGTATAYNNLAHCLDRQGRLTESLSTHRKALAIYLQVLGEQNAQTATSYSNVAMCLITQGRLADALPLLQKALDIRLKVLGEGHPHTSAGYNNLAGCLNEQGKHAEALPLFRKALDIRRKALGERHPATARSRGNLAGCLHRQGKHAEALPLMKEVLAGSRKVLGEQHPETADAYTWVAGCLIEQGKHAEAIPYLEKALAGSEWGRLHASTTGFDRSLSTVGVTSPRSALAACLVKLGKPEESWQHAEADLARGLLDDLLPAPAEGSADAGRRARLRSLERALVPLLTLDKPDAEQVKRREALAKERDRLLAELADRAARRLRERVLPLSRVRKQLADDAALVFWLDMPGEHLGCVLRRQGPPAWVRLPGSGKDNAWEKEDWLLPRRALAALANGRGEAAPLRRVLARLHRQRLTPLAPHLKGVRRLLVVPAGELSAVPTEALTDRYTVSYVPSASVFARLAEAHRPLQASSLLVLADPAFRRAPPKPPAAPPHGLLVLAVLPGGVGARVGLRPGDVLLEYDGKKLTDPAHLAAAEGTGRVPLKLWREGKALQGRVPTGKLGVAVDKRPVAEALAAWRKRRGDLVPGRGGEWEPLPGTRLEAVALAALVPRTTALLGPEASQQRLAELASADRLREFRLLHLATHGQANSGEPRLTALVLAQDRLDEAAAVRAVLGGKRPADGRLTVGDILADWKLDADLVVLSACQTGLGTDTRSSEGMLGFTQALLQKGARAVVLSRWRVNDSATALLMTRFYENLLGKRKGTKPLGRAAALAEAKTWLRNLGRAEATKRLAALVDGVPRGERGSIKAALPTRRPDAPKGEDRPFAAPYYWAAFVLIGDPD